MIYSEYMLYSYHFYANSDYLVQRTALPYFLLRFSFLVPSESLRKLVITLDNVVALNRKSVFTVGDKYCTFCYLM